MTRPNAYSNSPLLVAAALTICLLPNSAFADVRDANRTAGETADTVLRPLPTPSKKETAERPKSPDCMIIWGMRICKKG